MPHLTRLPLIWVALALALTAAAGIFAVNQSAHAAPAATTAPAADPTGAEALISVAITSLSNVSLQEGTFHANFYLGVACSEPCRADEWELVNAISYTSDITLEEAGTTWWQISGTFVLQPDVRLFPFDTQYLPIIIEHQNLTVEQLTLVPNVPGSEVSSEIGVPGWSLEPFTFTSSEHYFPAFDETYSQVEFDVPIGRSAVASITKYYIPLLTFILLGLATLFLGRNDYQVRTAGTALVGLTVFYVFTAGGVGSVGYLTVWDVSVIVGFIALGLVLLAGIIGSHLFHEHKMEGEAGEALNKKIRFGFLTGIIIFLAISAVIIALVASLT